MYTIEDFYLFLFKNWLSEFLLNSFLLNDIFFIALVNLPNPPGIPK
jgi:hypothetical protein